MFKLVAFLFMMSAPEQPVHAMTYNQSTFPTEDACRAFLESDDGRAVFGSFNMVGAASGLVVRFTCLEAKDNSI